MLIRLADGRRVWAVTNGVSIHPEQVPVVLQQRISAYRWAGAETEALLAIAGEI